MSVMLSLIIGEQKYKIKIMKNARCSCKDKRELNVRIKDIYIYIGRYQQSERWLVSGAVRV